MTRQLIIYLLTIILFACTPNSRKSEVVTVTNEERSLKQVDTLPLSFIQKEGKDRIKRDATSTEKPKAGRVKKNIASQ